MMNSENLRERGFEIYGEWKLSDTGKLELIGRDGVLEGKGVYAFILCEEFGRLQGRSDILYIGRAKKFETRLDRYSSNPDKSQITNRRVGDFLVRLLEEGYRIHVYFKVLNDDDDIGREERKLLEQYECEHYELPPFNRRL